MVRAMVAVLNTLMLPRMNAIDERLSSLEKRAREFENTLTIIEQQRAQVNRLEVEHKALKEENARLKEELQTTAQTALSTKRYSYQYNLLLHGVSESHPGLAGATSSRDPNFKQCVLGELRKFHSSITENDFERAHRLGPPRPLLVGPGEPAPRAILIKFYNRDMKEELLEASIRRFKERKSGTSGASMQGTNEPYLTAHRLRDPTDILTKTRTEREEGGKAPEIMLTRKRKESLPFPPKTVQQIRQEKLRRQRK